VTRHGEPWSSTRPDRKLRVCFVLSTRGFVFGGLETVADQLARGLAERGHRVGLLAGTVPGRPRRGDSPPGVQRMDVAMLPATSLPVRATGRLVGTQPLNVQSLTFFFSLLARNDTRRALNESDVVVTFLEGEAVLFSRYLARRNVGSIYYYSGAIDPRWAFRDRSTLRIANSQTLAHQSWQSHGYTTQGVVTPGVPSTLLDGPAAGERPGDPRRLVYVGRLERTPKRIDWLLALLAVLTPSFPDLSLRLVGEGAAQRELEIEVHERRLQDRVTFCGALPPEGVAAELRQADLFLFPSTYESFGIAPLEAMAAGVPVIATDLPALREATGGHATLVPADDLSAWLDATRQLLADLELRRRLAREGRAWAAGFTWDRVIDRFEPFVYRAARGRPV
jgi:glycosyltransferase involved in cell wall biosynthesis